MKPFIVLDTQFIKLSEDNDFALLQPLMMFLNDCSYEGSKILVGSKTDWETAYHYLQKLIKQNYLFLNNDDAVLIENGPKGLFDSHYRYNLLAPNYELDPDCGIYINARRSEETLNVAKGNAMTVFDMIHDRNDDVEITYEYVGFRLCDSYGLYL